MDKIMSTRIDEAVVRRIDLLAKKLGTSKKAVIENAIRHYAQKVDLEHKFDIFAHTLGCWQRDEPAAKTVERIKTAMRRSQERYKR
ncbi:MAG: ribbon-helix-helix protein, CopG family [Desulfobacterales bacterium]|uniref:Ribbon-helix-helix protein, CopG family n=1 Tax=Candidatus Desulfatibia profunda TaxID=2841695 RepID=A0A8J6TI75_9BACT|nr:ribbon-helix-helix protein, CopG family [Candidatus Desulfatibia profunda]MBL7178952.1 ribbon-helix-helix protein, CopG family [Desulfobacterales bacterium]